MVDGACGKDVRVVNGQALGPLHPGESFLFTEREHLRAVQHTRRRLVIDGGDSENEATRPTRRRHHAILLDRGDPPNADVSIVVQARRECCGLDSPYDHQIARNGTPQQSFDAHVATSGIRPTAMSQE